MDLGAAGEDDGLDVAVHSSAAWTVGWVEDKVTGAVVGVALAASVATAAAEPAAAADPRHKARYKWRVWSAQKQVEGCCGADSVSGRV